MTRFVFFLEEPSSKAMLEVFLPKFLPSEIQYRYHIFEGKQDLEKQLPRKLKGYKSDGEESIFVILRDQDSADCKKVKDNLKRIVAEAGRGDVTFICIVCRELESWYLADLKAVGLAYDLPELQDKQKTKKYRSPDFIDKPSLELKKLTKELYRKSDSKLIAEHLNCDNQRSHSFKYFVQRIKERANLTLCKQKPR